MSEPVDLYHATYGHFADPVLRAIRAEAFGRDLGQNSWVTAEEYDRFLDWLGLGPEHHALEVASGSGGPALYVARKTGCRITGVDVNEDGVATATALASGAGESGRVRFQVADVNRPLPFGDATFDALICADSMNHFPDRLAVLREWRRVLRPGGRAVFTDPVVVTGLVRQDELAERSSIGIFVFAPPGENERLIEEAGLRLARREDGTANAALVAGRWRDARARRREALLATEGEARFEGLQRFFAAVHRLSSERRLSRFVYFADRAPE